MDHSLPADRHGLIRFADVREQGRQSELSAAMARGEVERVRRGVYRLLADGSHVALHPGGVAEQARLAYLTEVRAAALAFRFPVFTSYSAAALLGLPIIGGWPAEVFVLSNDRHGTRRPGVITVARTREVGVRRVDGCAVTSVEFTLLQLARHAPLIAALTAADAALRVPRYGDAGPMTTLERLREEQERVKPYPRSRRFDAVLRRATTLAESPLESGSRLLIEELGFAEPELQHRLWLPELGRPAFLDFYWPQVDVGAEADGQGKYHRETGAPSPASIAQGDPRAVTAASSAARRAARAVIEEKDRENAIRRQLAGFDRWDWDEMLRKHPVETRLRQLGVPRVRRPRLLI